jgi:hypothetical protein
MRYLSDAEWSRLFANSGVNSHDARPAGFEPATGGLEVLADESVDVRFGTESRLNRRFPC